MLADLVGAIPKHLTRLGLARSLRGRGRRPRTRGTWSVRSSAGSEPLQLDRCTSSGKMFTIKAEVFLGPLPKKTTMSGASFPILLS